MMSIFSTKALSIFLYLHVVSDKKWHLRVIRLLNLGIYFYICIFVVCTVYLLCCYFV